MAVGDYSTTAASNTAISGIDISENCSPAGINNAIRQMMADIATGLGDGSFGDLTGYQPLDASLTALAALVTAADKGLYFTGADTPATFDITAFALTMLDDATAADVRTTIDAMQSPSISGSASSGMITIGGITLTWRDHTFPANSSTTYAYGNSHTYSSWARAWVDAGRQALGAQDNNPFVASPGVSSATVYSSSDASCSGTLFSIGV